MVPTVSPIKCKDNTNNTTQKSIGINRSPTTRIHKSNTVAKKINGKTSVVMFFLKSKILIEIIIFFRSGFTWGKCCLKSTLYFNMTIHHIRLDNYAVAVK